MINNNPNRMIPYEKCIEIIDDCADMGVQALQYTGGGEPTVHPKHKEIFQYTIDKGLDLALVTNGTIMRKGVPEILAQGKWVVIGVGFVVTKENWREIYDAVEIYSKLGVDNVRISAVFTPEDFHYHREHFKEAKELTRLAKKDFETKDFLVFDLFGDRILDLQQHRPDYEFCSYMHLNTYIGGDLKVYNCCNNAYNDHGDMGSLEDQRFIDYWTSSEKIKKYAKFKANSCERCMFNTKNRFINYMIESNPLHVNYI